MPRLISSHAALLVFLSIALSACGGGNDSRLEVDLLAGELVEHSNRLTSLESQVSDLRVGREALRSEVEGLKWQLGVMQDAWVRAPETAERDMGATDSVSDPDFNLPPDNPPEDPVMPTGSAETNLVSAELKPFPDDPIFSLHIASYRRVDQAARAWPGYVDQFPEILTDLSPMISRLEVDSLGGVYFRLKAGPVVGREEADKRCLSLVTHGEYCVVSAFDGKKLDEYR